MFFSAYRRAIRERKRVEADRDYWKDRAEKIEAKLEARTDFYVEREMRLIDRFLTSKAKTHAITDEIRAKSLVTPEVDSAYVAKLNEYLEEKKEELIEHARQAGLPAETAIRDFERNRDFFIVDFQQNASVIG
jgi:hypothetical protein